MSCYKTSNNKFFNSPALMSDGRSFTDYRPNCEVNNHIIDSNNVTNVHDYRMFLVKNAEKIMGSYNKYLFKKNGMVNCKKPFETGTMVPEYSRVVCDQHTCKRVVVNKNGIGEGREYSTLGKNNILEPLKKPEYELDDNVCSTLEDNFNYYPYENVYDKDEVRNVVPSGSKLLVGGDPNVFHSLG